MVWCKTFQEDILCEKTVWFDNKKSFEALILTSSVTLNKLLRLRVCFLLD